MANTIQPKITSQPVQKRHYPDFSKAAKVHPELAKEMRLVYDSVYDVRDAVMAMVAPPSALAQIDNTGKVSLAMATFPGVGVKAIKKITVSGGGGTGAVVTGTVVNGRVALTLGNPGSGYTFAPTITVEVE